MIPFPWWLQMLMVAFSAFWLGCRAGIWYARGDRIPGVVTGDDARRLHESMRRNEHRGCILCDGSGYKDIMIGMRTKRLPCVGPLSREGSGS